MSVCLQTRTELGATQPKLSQLHFRPLKVFIYITYYHTIMLPSKHIQQGKMSGGSYKFSTLFISIVIISLSNGLKVDLYARADVCSSTPLPVTWYLNYTYMYRIFHTIRHT